MKPLDIAKTDKKDLIWLSKHHCKHGHPYLSHYTCYLKERKGKTEERVGILDIETNGLNANFGIILSYCIKELGGGVVGRHVSTDELRSGVYDLELVRELVNEMMKYDRLIVYYGKNKRFDIPFIRTRAIFHKLWFPEYRQLIITDLYDIVKTKLKLHSNRLQAACDAFGIKAKSHPMHPRMWMDAIRGEKEALQYILEHNVEDVESTEELWNKVHMYQRPEKTSI